MIDLFASTGECSTCHERKSLIDFYPNPKTASGRMYSCKSCMKSYSSARRRQVALMDRSSEMPDFDPEVPISYMGAHQRVHYWRGKASIHQCACGAVARDWAYRHDSPHELSDVVIERSGQPTEVKYSPIPMDYDPMCQSCHVKFDRNRT